MSRSKDDAPARQKRVAELLIAVLIIDRNLECSEPTTQHMKVILVCVGKVTTQAE